jgi:hypothetical protein
MVHESSTRAAKLVAKGLLAVLAATLALTAIPGIFTVDDANHIAAVFSLRHGQLGMPGTEHLPPSPELLYFDPAARSRSRIDLPVVGTLPPLYAMLALPFSWFGVRGLQWLNILATIWAAWLVWLYAGRHARRSATPWIALALFVAGGYVLEYATGIWAHGLSLGLCATAYWHVSRARNTGDLHAALLGGVVVGVAVGVRYQNAIIAALLGIGLVALGDRARRVWHGAAYGFGVSLPLALSSWLNHVRLGFWNPISKGPGYLDPSSGKSWSATLAEAAHAIWARIVDSSVHPPFPPGLHNLDVVMRKDPDCGAFVFLGVVHKALLQSAPWLALVLVTLALVWLLPGDRTPRRTQELRSASIVFAGVIGAFASFGFRRTDGVSFNERYLLELLPLGAVCAAWALEELPLRWRWLTLATAAGLATAGIALWLPGALGFGNGPSRVLVVTLPVTLAGLLVATTLGRELGRSSPRAASWAARALPMLTAVGFGWAAMIHLATDVRASRARRAWNQRLAAGVEAVLPPTPVAIFAHWGAKDPLPVLHFEHDLVVADTWVDQGRSARALSEVLLAQGRTVFIVPRTMPLPILDQLLEGRQARLLAGPLTMLELATEPPSELAPRSP